MACFLLSCLPFVLSLLVFVSSASVKIPYCFQASNSSFKKSPSSLHKISKFSSYFWKMGNRSSKTRDQSSPNPQPPPPTAPPPAPANTSNSDDSPDLSSYESACEEDPELQAFDSALQARTTKAINSVAVTLDYRALSLDSLREVTLCFLEMNQEVVNLILESKRDIWKDPDLFDLVKDYLENSRHTMNFCTALEDALQRANHSQSILKFALQKFEEESGHDSAQLYSNTLSELKKFKDAGDPFPEKFFSLFHSVYRQQELMLNKMKEKKSRLDKKLRKVKSWRRISNVIFATVFVSVLICSVVAAVVTAPPVVTALAAAASVPMGTVGKWINSMWKKYENELKREREILTTIGAGNYIVIQDLESIQRLVDKLQEQMQGLLYNADFAMQQNEAVSSAMEDIKKNVVSFMETIQILTDQADKCSRDIRMAHAVILKKINEPTSANSSGNVVLSIASC